MEIVASVWPQYVVSSIIVSTDRARLKQESSSSSIYLQKSAMNFFNEACFKTFTFLRANE